MFIKLSTLFIDLGIIIGVFLSSLLVSMSDQIFIKKKERSGSLDTQMSEDYITL